MKLLYPPGFDTRPIPLRPDFLPHPGGSKKAFMAHAMPTRPAGQLQFGPLHVWRRLAEARTGQVDYEKPSAPMPSRAAQSCAASMKACARRNPERSEKRPEAPVDYRCCWPLHGGHGGPRAYDDCERVNILSKGAGDPSRPRGGDRRRTLDPPFAMSPIPMVREASLPGGPIRNIPIVDISDRAGGNCSSLAARCGDGQGPGPAIGGFRFAA